MQATIHNGPGQPLEVPGLGAWRCCHDATSKRAPSMKNQHSMPMAVAYTPIGASAYTPPPETDHSSNATP